MFNKLKQKQVEFEQQFVQLVEECLASQLHLQEREILEKYKETVNADNFKVETPRLERDLGLATAFVLKEGKFPTKSVSDLILVIRKNAKYCQIAPLIIPFPL